MPAPWPADLKARALELLAEHPPAKARRALARELDVDVDSLPSTSTLRGWAITAGVRRVGTDTKPPADPAAAVEARLEELHAAREDLSALLVQKISTRAASAILKRLDRNDAAEVIVDDVMARWRDALIVEAQAADFGEEAVREARKATKPLLAELEHAERLLIPVHNLVGILTRGVGDHLALEGLATEQAAGGDLIVELLIPEPEETTPVPEDTLERSDA